MQRYDEVAHSHEENVEPILLSHLVRTFARYRLVFVLSLCAVIFGTVLCGLLVYLLAPTARVTSLPFRLEFTGAEKGTYPNGTKFSSVDIVNPQALESVYQANNLQKYLRFVDFANSVFVLESNRAYELLAMDYQARLNDAKLTTVDRERLEREFMQKRESLNKNELALTFVQGEKGVRIPDVVAKKILSDILSTWARQATTERKVMLYTLPVISPDLLASFPVTADPIVALMVLRSKVLQVLDNITLLETLPGAQVVRTGANHVSLNDIRMQLTELVRFRLDPLILRARTVTNTTDALRFAEAQLEYDKRNLETQHKALGMIRESFLMYADQRPLATDQTKSASSVAQQKSGSPSAETLMPQISDTFLDRLVALTSDTADRSYRQLFVDEYKGKALNLVPAENAVLYDTDIINQLKAPTARSQDPEAARSVQREIESARRDSHDAVVNVYQLYLAISKNLNPSTEMYSTIGPSTSTIQRSTSVRRIALWCTFVVLLSIPLIIVASLLHNRIRKEEMDDLLHEEAAAS